MSPKERPRTRAASPRPQTARGVAPQPEPHPRTRSRRRWLWPGSALILLSLGAMVLADWWFTLPENAQAQFVGRRQCAECHQQEHRLFEGSHHDLAMDVASDATVLADFNDAELSHYGVQSRMFRQDGKFMVHTEGPDGKMADFQVKYVFGVTPLQQYMVEFDREEGMPTEEVARLQVLRLSWDTQGKKWFHLDPPDVQERLAPDDQLHWTGVAQRWNNMCADCHSTNVQKNFDAKALQYHTTFSEIDVSCESCHGPGSLHVDMARSRSLFWDRRRGYGLAPLKDADHNKQIDSCAQCHARRRILAEQYHAGLPYYDYFATELMAPQLYYADGQILDEVYVHGSFLQSKMYQKGIRCTDCHDPHTARVKHVGNELCTSCHQKQHPAAKYDTPSHHHHQIGSSGASCVECHMPQATYMELDARRDHSLRSPRPDLSVQLHTPNACTRCHLDLEKEQALAEVDAALRPRLRQYNDWVQAAHPFSGLGDQSAARVLQRLDAKMAEAFAQWYGQNKERPRSFAAALESSWRGSPQAYELLAPWLRTRTTPAFVRASGWSSQGSLPAATSPERTEAVNQLLGALDDRHPLVRAAAVTRLEEFLPSRLEMPEADREQQTALALANQIRPLTDRLLPLLQDPSRSVRIEAARSLTRIPPLVMPLVTRGSQRDAYDAAFEELVGYMNVHRDRAGSLAALANLQELRGHESQAEQLYRQAIELEPNLVGPRANLAALNDRLAEEADRQARQAVSQRNQDALQRYAEIVARRQQTAQELRDEELPLLARDARLAANNAGVQHRYGLALYLHGDMEPASLALERALALDPDNERFLLILVLFYQRLGEFQRALPLARDLAQRAPEHAQLLEEIRKAAGASPAADAP